MHMHYIAVPRIYAYSELHVYKIFAQLPKFSIFQNVFQAI